MPLDDVTNDALLKQFVYENLQNRLANQVTKSVLSRLAVNDHVLIVIGVRQERQVASKLTEYTLFCQGVDRDQVI